MATTFVLRAIGARWREYRGALLFLVLMLVFRASWADWVRVPTGSMNPTIVEGDRVLVDKHVYGLRVPLTHLRLTAGESPRRGDIVVFDSPATGQSLVKRVIGLPGDVVAMESEALVINGVRVSYARADSAHLRDVPDATRAAGPLLVRERLPGLEHDVMLLPSRAARSSFAPVRIPADSYLMLGDSRDNSADSRYFGLVPRANIVGRASRVVASFDPERYYLPRLDRVLLPIS
jgi:signal peptidase I